MDSDQSEEAVDLQVAGCSGSGEEEEHIKNLINDLKLNEEILFLGAISNKELPPYYATADIFIGPSIIAKSGDTEGLPVTYMEAMASGCYIIGSDLEGNKDIIKDGITGSLVKQKSSSDISKKVIDVLKNKKKSEKIAKKGMNYVNKNFGWPHITKRYSIHLKRKS